MSAEEDLTSFEEDLKEVFQAIYSDPSNSDSILDAKDTVWAYWSSSLFLA